MKLKVLFIIFIALHLYGCCQVNVDCDKILDQECNIYKHNVANADSSLLKDITILEQCGNFDSVSIELLKGPVLAPILLQHFNENKPLTYRLLLQYIDDFKKTDGYKKFAELTLLSKQMENKKVDPKNWDSDKKLFEQLGMSESEMAAFKEFISKPENANLTYKQASLNYFNKNSVPSGAKKAITKTVFDPLLDFDAAIAKARDNKKPLLLYFTCYACVNGAKMQYAMLSDPDIKSMIDNNFVSYAAYVDDESELAIRDQYISKTTGKKITTLGLKLYELEAGKFKYEYQPYCVIIDNNGNVLGQIYYSGNPDEIKKFLNDGIKKYGKQ